MKDYRGIILAGGSGTRLFPVTQGVTKQLLPLYNKSMIYYPISVLMMAEIRDILIITTPEDADSFKRLLGDGSQYGINLQYAVQPKPEGIAQAFLIGEEFLDGHPACLILGDNIFHGSNFTTILDNAKINGTDLINSATVFGYYVNDPERYGVAEFNQFGECLSIEEKPQKPKSNYAVVGLYFYPSDVVEKAKKVKPSARGELEITTLNQMYINEGRMKIEILNRGFAWFDTGTFDSLNEASNFVRAIEKRQGLLVGSPEETAYRNKWITRNELYELALPMQNNDYGRKLLKIANK
jgi:glucose-1-phosphate thymidylyltransferase